MALQLPPSFKRDIEGRDTSLFPLVIIGNFTDAYSSQNLVDWLNLNSIHISTNNFTHNYSYDSGGTSYEYTINALPLLSNIPSLKESIDLEKRSYKISNLTLNISNYPYEGKRFSELVTGSLINTEVRIFWWSPSAKHLFPTDKDPTWDYIQDRPLQVYYGTIRRYDHDDEKVKLTIEDRSQATLHKDLPSETFNDGDTIKYKPLAYGKVDNSPATLDKSEAIANVWLDTDEEVKLQKKVSDTPSTDYIYPDTLFSVPTGSLKMFIDGSYVIVLDKIRKTFPSYAGYSQGAIAEGEAQIATLTEGIVQYDEGVSSNILKIHNTALLFNNFIQCSHFYKPKRLSLIFDNNLFTVPEWDDGDDATGETGLLFDDSLADTWVREFDWFGTSAFYPTTSHRSRWWFYINCTPTLDHGDVAVMGLAFNGNLMPMPSDMSIINRHVSVSPNSNAFSYDGDSVDVLEGTGTWATEWEDNGWTTPAFSPEEFIWFPSFPSGDYEVANSYIEGNEDSMFKIGASTNTYIAGGGSSGLDRARMPRLWIGWQNITLGSHLYNTYLMILENMHPSNIGVNTAVDFSMHIKIKEMDTAAILDIEKPLNQKFYADVYGRAMQGDGTVSPTAPQAIAHLMETEFGIANIADETTYDFKYAFAYDKKINSKKLIEGISSASPYIPRFTNMGDFKFDVIPPDGGTAQHTIYEADVIDFNFSRTKIEDVYTKVELHWNWDYAREEFADPLEPVTADELFTGYDTDYYGLKEVDGDIHVESTLVVDDDRGKYIRDYGTAVKFAYWLLSWHCNQHLKMKVKLPLKYMNLEIGDLIEFDKVLGGVKPYGISYNKNSTGQVVNEQPIFPTFMITSTNKTLEWVEISCTMMHKIQLSPCTGEYDCAGNCSSDEGYVETIEDDCGSCGGGCFGSDGCVCSECFDDYGNTYPPDCFNVCDGTAVTDECGVCEGDGAAYDCGNGLIVCDPSQCPNEFFDGGVCSSGEATADECIGEWQEGCFLDCTGDGSSCNWDDIAWTMPNLVKITGIAGSVTPDDCIIDFSFVSGNSVSYKIEGFNVKYNHYPYFEGDINKATATFFIVTNFPDGSNAVITLDITSLEHSTFNSIGEGSTEIIFRPSGSEPIDLFTFENLTDGDNFKLFVKLEVETNLPNEETGYHTDMVQFNATPSGCVQTGDITGDGLFNILDIVQLANCVLSGPEGGVSCDELDWACAADINGDGYINVLDIVQLANCILAGTCGG